MHKVVSEYRQFVEELPKRIKKSSFKPMKFIEKTGIPKASFYKKMQKNNFTRNEIEKISNMLYAEELIDQRIKKGEEDIVAGRIIENPKQAIDDFLKEVKNRRGA